VLAYVTEFLLGNCPKRRIAMPPPTFLQPAEAVKIPSLRKAAKYSG